MRKLKPQNTYKHLIGFCSKSTSRPILTGIHINETGDMTATDSHILLKLHKRLTVPEGTNVTLQPKSMAEIEGNYPETDRLIPKDFKTEFFLDPDVAIQIVKFLKGLEKGERVSVKVGLYQLKIGNDSSSANFDILDNAGESSAGKKKLTDDYFMEFWCNSTFLSQVCAVIGDIAPVPVQVGIVSPVRPVVFKQEGVFTALLTPVRK